MTPTDAWNIAQALEDNARHLRQLALSAQVKHKPMSDVKIPDPACLFPTTLANVMHEIKYISNKFCS